MSRKKREGSDEALELSVKTIKDVIPHHTADVDIPLFLGAVELLQGVGELGGDYSVSLLPLEESVPENQGKGDEQQRKEDCVHGCLPE